MKKIFALSVFTALMGSAHAEVIDANSIDSVESARGRVGTPDLAKDWLFRNDNLTAKLARNYNHNTLSGYTLSVTSVANSNFTYSHGHTSLAATGQYTLIANFNSSGVFQSGTETIIGKLNPHDVLPANSVNDLDKFAVGGGQYNLFSASLTGFGFNDGESRNRQYSLGFKTHFNPAWGTQAFFTGGSSGEETYLFGKSYSSDKLAALTEALSEDLIQHNATGLYELGNHYSVNNLSSITAVPLPLSAVLFGGGLTLLLGFRRQSR